MAVTKLEVGLQQTCITTLNNNAIYFQNTKMTGVAIDALSIYSDLKIHNLLLSVEQLLWSQNYAQSKDEKM